MSTSAQIPYVKRAVLANVLACLTTESDVAWWLRRHLAPPMRVTASGVAWAHQTTELYPLPREWRKGLADPAEALAALVEAEVVPEHWTDAARAPRWWCEACDGTGEDDSEVDERIDDYGDARLVAQPCAACEEEGIVNVPPSHAALVAVAALSRATLARVEAVVAETWLGARLVWRVMSKSDIAGSHARGMYSDSGESCVGAFSHEQMLSFLGSHRKPWPLEPRERCCADVRRAWPAMRALAVRDTDAGPQPTGLSLVDLDAARVVLAVEALS